MSRSSLTLAEARRISLAAQGFGKPRPESKINVRHIRNVIHKLGLLQLDFVNVLTPAHYLVLFSRLGNYDLKRFERAVYRCDKFTEQWAHEASIVPAQYWPLLAHRRESFKPWPNSAIMKIRNRPAYLAEVLDIVSERGPVTAADLPPVAGPRRKPGDWHRSVPRSALDYHFGQGNIAVTNRLPNFQRSYDLPERILGEALCSKRLTRADAERELVRIAAVAYGIATLQDIADYFRMSPRDTKPYIDDLEEEGELSEVNVQGWQQPAWLARGARIPRRINTASLLSPFDPLVWFRPRAERLFDFHYRIEIYVPEKKRKWGYYVLPFLLDDRIVARVDLKADRANGVLLVQNAIPEAKIDMDQVASRLNAELRQLAAWLGLPRIKVRRRGQFARILAAAVKAHAGER